MRIALAQITATQHVVENLELVRAQAAQAAAQRAELVVFPEATMCSFGRARLDAAEPFDGPWAQAVRGIAANAGLTIVVGMFTTTKSQLIRNTTLVAGAIEARYDKIHLFDALGYAESDQIEAGTEAAWFDLGEHRIGLASCYDVRFPALFTHLAGQGAELILLPASWAPGEGKVDQWRTLVTARAMDSTSFVVAVDQSSSAAAGERIPTGVGHSMVVDPTGKVLLELGESDELAVIDIDLVEVAGVRKRLPVLAHARSFGPRG